MAINSLQDLYQLKLAMMLDAEQQGLQAYPQLIQQVRNDQLRQALQSHLQQTQQQAQQLQQLFQQGGSSPQQQKDKAMQALIQEAQQLLGQINDPDTKDAFIIGAAQAVEHLEIAAYGTARAWATQLGRQHDVQVLEQILSQEEQTDQRLTRLAEHRVNAEAAQSDREVPMNAQNETRGSQGATQGSAQPSSRTGPSSGTSSGTSTGFNSSAGSSSSSTSNNPRSTGA